MTASGPSSTPTAPADGPAAAAGRPGSWLVGRPLPVAPGRNLYCFPHSGGSAGEYVRWGRDLPGTQVYGIGLPGRAGRAAEPALTRLDDLVNALLDATSFAAPYVLFGHSLGALVAYEVTRELAARGRPLPERLVVSAFAAPHLPRDAPRLHERPDAELAAALIDRYGGIPRQVARDPELMALFLPAFRADLTLLENYVHRPGAPVPVPIEVFGGDTDVVTADQLRLWSRHSSVSTRLRLFRGGHFYFRDDSEPLLSALDALL